MPFAIDVAGFVLGVRLPAGRRNRFVIRVLAVLERASIGNRVAPTIFIGDGALRIGNGTVCVSEFDSAIAAIEGRVLSAQSGGVTLAAFLWFAEAMTLDLAGAWQRAGAEQRV